MVAAVWTVIALLAGSMFWALQHLGSKIDGVRVELGARIDAQGAELGAQIRALSARIDAQSSRIDAHLERHLP
jgi:hypothetical protein